MLSIHYLELKWQQSYRKVAPAYRDQRKEASYASTFSGSMSKAIMDTKETLNFTKTFHINSSSGIQQGDPIGSVLFEFALHPLLSKFAESHPGIFITAYADNIVFTGPFSLLKEVTITSSKQRFQCTHSS